MSDGGRGIWKYSISLDDIAHDEIAFDMPRDAVPISAERQNRDLCIWIVGSRFGTRPDMKEGRRRAFRVGTTGHDPRLSDLEVSDFLGTVQFEEYGLVLHIFDLGWKSG